MQTDEGESRHRFRKLVFSMEGAEMSLNCLYERSVCYVSLCFGCSNLSEKRQGGAV